MKQEIVIPKICKVGFKHRENTYSKRLGYVIWHDEKVWRKEPSWENWRTKYITKEEYENNKREAFEKQVEFIENEFKNCVEIVQNKTSRNLQFAQRVVEMGLEGYKKEKKLSNIEEFRYIPGNYSYDKKLIPFWFKNEPREGFVLNKRAGGGGSWSQRETYCRVYDPLGFEIEITVENLLYILQNTSCIKGKGLEGKFLYGWRGTELILLPENAPEVSKMREFTQLQNKKIIKNELIEGKVYKLKDNTEATYMGYRMHYDNWKGGLPTSKKLWVYQKGDFHTITIKKFALLIGDNPNYSELFVKFNEDERIKPKETEMVLATPENIVFDEYNRSTVYVKIKSKFKRSQIYKEVPFSWEKHRVINYHYNPGKGTTEKYSSLSELLTKHQLWILQLKTTP